jgi:hypothetical protein
MRTVEEVRRARLQLLLAQHGSWAKLNELTGKKKLDSTFSQISGQAIGSKSGSPKQMGSAMARQLEENLGLPRGLMDTDPELLDPSASTPAQAVDKPGRPKLAEALPVVLNELAKLTPGQWRMVRARLDDLPEQPAAVPTVLADVGPVLGLPAATGASLLARAVKFETTDLLPAPVIAKK